MVFWSHCLFSLTFPYSQTAYMLPVPDILFITVGLVNISGHYT